MALITETQSGLRYSGSLLSGMQAVLRRLAGMRKTRRTLNVLDNLDDRQLRDIGLTRSDLIELRLATSADLGLALTRLRPRL